MDKGKISLGVQVRFKPEMARAMGKFGDDVGVVTAQPIGSYVIPPPDGVYVQWSKLREPAPCFIDDLEVVESTPAKSGPVGDSAPAKRARKGRR